MKLNSEQAVPLYRQLKNDLLHEIVSGSWKPGQKIPTEAELSRQYHVSRITVRRAIEELCMENYLSKHQGKGTFVRYHKIQRKLIHTLMSFSRSCKSNGMTCETKCLSKKRILLDQETADEMGWFPGDEVIYTQRLRHADGVPIMLENNYFPGDRFAFLLEEPLDESLFDLLSGKYHIQVTSSRESYVDVVRANGAIAKQLQIPIGEPLFFLFTKNYDQNGRLVHMGKQYILGERYRFYLDDMEN